MNKSKPCIAALAELGEHLCYIYIQDDNSFPGGIWSWRIYIDGDHHSRGPGSTRKNALKYYALLPKGTHCIVIRDSDYSNTDAIESNTLYFTIVDQTEIVISATYCEGIIKLNVANRKIRSFIRRQGRITPGQQFALEQYWDKYCLSPAQPLNQQEVFGRVAPLVLEIGFGNGDCLAQMAKAMPDKDFIGIEVHRPGVGRLLMRLQEQDLSNVRVYCNDAIEILQYCIKDHSLAAIHLFFPDPWPKKKHHKRRIVQPEFLDLIALKLQSGGYFHAATDWQGYAESMLETLSADVRFQNTSKNGMYSAKPNYRPLTKFEQRGLRLGHGVWDLVFVAK